MLDHLGSFHMSSSPIQVAVHQAEGLPLYALPLLGLNSYVLIILESALLLFNKGGDFPE